MCFGVDGVDELDEVGELVEAVVVVGGIEADTEGADAGVAVEAESFDDTFVVANEIGVESDGGGDSGASGLAVAREPQSLDFGDIVGIPLAGEGLVVKVRLRRPHGSEGKGVALGVAASGFFEIVGELEASRDSEFDVVEGASGCGGAFTYEVEERVSGLREERRADPPVGDFTGEPQVGGAERCDVDGHVDRASRERSARPSLSGSGSVYTVPS